jgi:MSHA biogenesis protein MshO
MNGPRFVSSGFTLIELIIVIVISGIIAVGSARFVANTATGYVATATRQENAALAVIVSQKISRELRMALPNSLRVNAGNTCIEFVPVLFGDRYVNAPIAPAAASTTVTTTNTTYSLSNDVDEYVVVYPSSPNSIYSPGNSSAITAAEIAAIPSANTITLGASHQFPANSPNRRLYIVSDPVSYCYASVSGENGIFRYSGYGFNSTMVAPPTGGTRSMLVNNVNPGTASFDVIGATLTRNAIAKISFQIASPVSYGADETLYIDQQVQTRNVP